MRAFLIVAIMGLVAIMGVAVMRLLILSPPGMTTPVVVLAPTATVALAVAVPTATPTIRSIPQPKNPEITVYAENIQTALVLYEHASIALNQSLRRMAANPALFGTEDWEAEVLAQAINFKIAARQIQSTTPPRLMAAYHADMLRVAGHLGNAADWYTLWLDDPEVSYMNAAIGEVNAATRAMDAAGDKLDKIEAG